jgi:hypothetical protein
MEVACHGLGATRARCGCRDPRQRMLSKLLPPGRKAIRVQVPAWMRRRTSLAMQDLRGQLDQPFSSVAGLEHDPESCSRLPQKGRVECPLQSDTERKQAEFRELLAKAPRSPNETSEFRKTYTTLAENEEWMAVHIDQTIQRIKNSDNRMALRQFDRD